MGYGILAYSNTLVSPVYENKSFFIARDWQGLRGNIRAEIGREVEGGRGEVEGRSRGGRGGHGMHILKYLVDLVGVCEIAHVWK